VLDPCAAKRYAASTIKPTGGGIPMLEKSLFYCPEEFQDEQKNEILNAIDSLKTLPLELNELRSSYIELLKPEIKKHFI